MTADPVLRPATPADRAVLEGFMAALQDFERLTEPNREAGAAMATDHLAALLDAAAADPAGGCLIAEADGRPAGFLLWIVGTEFGRYVAPENSRCAELSDLWVEPWARGRGIATRLIRAAEAHLAAHGVTRAEIGALAGNTAAQALYRRLGYLPYTVAMARQIGT